jgi:hypothetical protein
LAALPKASGATRPDMMENTSICMKVIIAHAAAGQPA